MNCTVFSPLNIFSDKSLNYNVKKKKITYREQEKDRSATTDLTLTQVSKLCAPVRENRFI